MFEEGSFRRRPRGFRRKCPLGSSPVTQPNPMKTPTSGSTPGYGGVGGGVIPSSGHVPTGQAYDMFSSAAAAAAAAGGLTFNGQGQSAASIGAPSSSLPPPPQPHQSSLVGLQGYIGSPVSATSGMQLPSLGGWSQNIAPGLSTLLIM